MIVLQETASEQTFSFIPRTEVYSSMFLRDDQNNTEVEVTITSSTQGDYYHTISAIFDLKQGRFYDLVLKDGTTIAYKDRVFCTNQNVVTYSVNDGQYTSHTSNNDFIVYE
jgi:hypothetical protein